MPFPNRGLALLAFGLGLSLATGCASASASGKANDRPGLVVPLPPPRVVEPTPEPPIEPVTDPATATATPPATPGGSGGRQGRGSREATPPKPADAKPDPKTEPPVAEPPAAPPASPPPQLRTPEDAGAAEKTARDTIERSRQLLRQVNYDRLSKERQKAYNDAKLFAQQAENALKTGNLVYAQANATKAETLARELANR